MFTDKVNVRFNTRFYAHKAQTIIILKLMSLLYISACVYSINAHVCARTCIKNKTNCIFMFYFQFFLLIFKFSFIFVFLFVCISICLSVYFCLFIGFISLFPFFLPFFLSHFLAYLPLPFYTLAIGLAITPLPRTFDSGLCHYFENVRKK